MVNEILLVPLTGGMLFEELVEVSNKLSEALNDVGLHVTVEVAAEQLEPPMKCFDWNRAQYLASCVVKEFLASMGDLARNRLVVLVGMIDAYEPGMNFVFGLASPGYGVAAVFAKRLARGEDRREGRKFVERLSKEVVHEVGHLLGLGHCQNATCVMRFSNSLAEVDEKSYKFCSSCARRLRAVALQMSRTK